MYANSKATSAYLNDRSFRISANNDYDNRCIAPAQRRDRCGLLIDAQEADEVATLTIELQRSVAGDAKEKVLRRLILLRCCGEYHRQKLEADQVNLEKVARRYDEILRTIKCPTLARYEAVPGEESNTPQASKPRYCLRPRHTDDRAEEAGTDIEASLFTPYRSSPHGSVENCLITDVSRADKRPGFVYALSWPTVPGYLKLGSSVCPPDRLAEWQRCHPCAKIIHSIEVPYPRRAERLIHLEMSRVRFQMILCQACGRTHLEWFKTNTSQMKLVMETWKKLFDKDTGLYDKMGKFSSDWEEKIRRSTHVLTAKRLMGIFYSSQARPKGYSWPERTQCLTDSIKSSSRSEECDKSLALKDKSQDQIGNRDWDIVVEYFDNFRQSHYGPKE
jgi:hypothetical protein